MNSIDELVSELAMLADDDGASERMAADYARRRLRRAMADARPRRSPWRFALPAAVAGGLAAVILGIVALLPAHESTAPAPASAAVVLERTAQVATQRPAEPYPSPHQYLYLKLREGWAMWERASNGSAFAFRETDDQQDWVAPNGSGRQRLIYDGPPRFLNARDRAAWVGAGRPVLIPPSTDTTYPAGGYPAGRQIDPAALPTAPAALLRAIVQRYEGGRYSVEQTFEYVATLLQDSGSPILRAALYRMVAHLHGVQLLGRQTDVLGRTGIAVALMGPGEVREELLFDPRTSDVLEEAQVADAHNIVPLPTGTVVHYFAYEGRGVVNSIEALPGGRKVPFHRGGP